MDTDTLTTTDTTLAIPADAANLTAPIESMILEIGDDTPPEQIAAVRGRVKFHKQQAAELQQLLDKRLVEIIESTGRDIVLSDTVRLYLGHPPDYTPQNPATLCEGLLAFYGGDFTAMVRDCFASKWFKPGAIREKCKEAGTPETFDLFFKTTNEPELKEGKPVKKLLETNGFARQRR